MAMSIRNKRVEALARDIARRRNISMTQAIIESLEEKSRTLGKAPGSEAAMLIEITEIARRCAALPDLDARTPDEILGYDDKGTFSW